MSGDIGLSARELQRRALHGVTWSTLSSSVALPLAVGVSVVLARSLGVHGYARFAYLSFLVPLLYQATDIGFAQATVRSASQSFAAGDLEATRALVGKALGWNLLRLPVLCGLILLVAHPGRAAAALVVLFTIASMAGGGLIFSFQAENRGATAAKLSFVQMLSNGAASVGAALAGASGTTVWAVAFASPIVVVPLWYLAANPELRRAALTPRLPRGLPAGFWRFGVTALAASLGYMLVFSRSEVAILNALADDRALAVFALAYGLSSRLTTPIDTLLGPLVPALSALDAAHPERMRAGFERALRLSSAAVAFLGASAVVGTALAAPVLFGPAYGGVGLAFAALAATSLLQSAAQPYTALAQATGRPGIALKALGLALVVDVAIAVALVPRFGLWGAVAANAAGAAVAVGLSARASAGRGSVRGARVPALRLVAVVLASAALAYAAALAAGLASPLLAVAAALLVGTGTFFALGRALGGLLDAGDVAVLVEALPRRLAPASRVAGLLVSP